MLTTYGTQVSACGALVVNREGAHRRVKSSVDRSTEGQQIDGGRYGFLDFLKGEVESDDHDQCGPDAVVLALVRRVAIARIFSCIPLVVACRLVNMNDN
jgi:hypothetical protein